MKRTRLDLEALAVDTFAPAAREGDGRAHSFGETGWGEYTCAGFGSCFFECLGTVIDGTC